jgi:hypothetical protein
MHILFHFLSVARQINLVEPLFNFTKKKLKDFREIFNANLVPQFGNAANAAVLKALVKAGGPPFGVGVWRSKNLHEILEPGHRAKLCCRIIIYLAEAASKICIIDAD